MVWMMLVFLIFPLVAQAATPRVEVVEVFYDAPGADSGREWVELVNLANQPVTITTGSTSEISWRFFDKSNHIFTLAAGADEIAPGERFILAADPNQFLASYPSYTGPLYKVALSLPNSDTTLKLSSDKGASYFFERSYPASLGGAGDGTTLEWTGSAWQVGPVGGTPGGPPGSPTPLVTTPLPAPSPAGSTPLPQLEITTVVFDPEGSDADREWLEVVNRSSTPVTIVTWRESGSWRLLVNGDKHLLTLAEGSATLAPGETAAIVQDVPTYRSERAGGPATLFTASFSLPNSGGTVGLASDEGATLLVEANYAPAPIPQPSTEPTSSPSISIGENPTSEAPPASVQTNTAGPTSSPSTQPAAIKPEQPTVSPTSQAVIRTVTGTVTASFSRSARLKEASTGTEWRILFRLAKGTKPSLSAGDQLAVTGAVSTDEGQPTLIVTDPGTIRLSGASDQLTDSSQPASVDVTTEKGDDPGRLPVVIQPPQPGLILPWTKILPSAILILLIAGLTLTQSGKLTLLLGRLMTQLKHHQTGQLTMPTSETLIIKNLTELDEFAKHLAAELAGGSRMGLEGVLGAGKTALTKAIARHLGVPNMVDSPTFVLRQSFPIPDHPTLKTLIHVDLYRLDDQGTNQQSVAELGLLDDWHEPENLIIIEWIDRAPELVPKLSHHLIIDWNKETDVRTITLNRKTPGY